MSRPTPDLAALRSRMRRARWEDGTLMALQDELDDLRAAAEDAYDADLLERIGELQDAADANEAHQAGRATPKTVRSRVGVAAPPPRRLRRQGRRPATRPRGAGRPRLRRAGRTSRTAGCDPGDGGDGPAESCSPRRHRGGWRR